MASSQLSPRFVIFVVASLITHLLELAACGLFCHMLFQQGDLKAPWFSVSAGLAIIPLVAVQLVSAVFLLKRKGESSTTYEVTATAVLHVLQLGFISRHFAVLQDAPITSKRAEVAEMLLLRLSFAITSGCTIFLTQAYLLFRGVFEASWTWAAYVSEITLLVSFTWALSTFRRSLPEVDFDLVVVNWPGTALKHLWRGGELLSRTIALGLFASIYTHWLFLVLGLHWVAMLVCLCIPVMASVDWGGVGCARRTLNCAMTSFVYIFAFINTSPENAVFRYTFFYVIIFLENATLIAVWLIQSTGDELSDNVAFVYVAAFAFVMSIASMIVYYKFFHVSSAKSSPQRPCGNENCDACKIVVGPHLPPIPPRPGVGGHWLSQYQASAYCGPELKHDKQDSLLDCERSSNATIGSLQARLQQKLASMDADLTDFSSSNSRRASDVKDGTSSFTGHVAAVATTPGNRSGKKDGKKLKRCLNNSGSEISSIRTDPDKSEDGGSQKRPVWLPSGDSNFTNQLLTCSLETFNAADDERSSVATASYHGHRKQSLQEATAEYKETLYTSMSLPRYVDHHWYSDGYCSDRTNDAKNDAVSPFQRTVWLAEPDNEVECCNCLEHSHGDSEVSSIMRSITMVPEYDDENGVESIRNLHVHNTHQRPCHHKRQFSDHLHHQPSTEMVTSKSEHSAPNERWLGSSLVGKHSREILSSPASDPSYGPNTKRKRSPKRKAHASVEPHQNASKYPGSSQSRTNSKLPHVNLNSNVSQVGSPRGDRDRFVRRDSLNHVDTLKNTLDEIPPTNSDPQLTARVMPCDDSLCVEILHQSPMTQEYSTSERELFARETVDDSGVSRDPSGDFSDNPEHDICETNSKVLKNFRGKRPVYPMPDADSTDVGLKFKTHADQQKDSGLYEKTLNTGDVIYENIWQVEKHHSSKNKHVMENNPRVPMVTQNKNVLYRSTPAPDAWYVCSESEDSALPPEILNSSIDCFTPSETESDLSMEIVI